MSDQVKQVAVEEFEQAKVLARDAVRSTAYLYPLKVSSPVIAPRGPVCSSSNGKGLLSKCGDASLCPDGLGIMVERHRCPEDVGF